MNTPLTLNQSRRPDGAPVLRVVGEVDRSNSDELAAAVGEQLDPAAGPLTVDLSGVGYLDSVGLSVLFEFADAIEVVIPPLLAPVLAVSGLGELTAVRGRPRTAGTALSPSIRAELSIRAEPADPARPDGRASPVRRAAGTYDGSTGAPACAHRL
jgi:anti-sigma B factor antagonist